MKGGEEYLLYEATRDDLQDAVLLMNKMKERGYNVSLTDVLIGNLSITLEEAIQRFEKSLDDIANNITYLQ